MSPSSVLATVMSQLFPFLVGSSLNLKEIAANKVLILEALMQFASRHNTLSISIEDGRLIPCEEGFRLSSAEENWKWFTQNFLYLTFCKNNIMECADEIKIESYPIYLTLCIATDIAHLSHRFQINLLPVEQLDMIHLLKKRFEEWFENGASESIFYITSSDISCIHSLLEDYKLYRYSAAFQSINLSQYWIERTSNIDNKIEACLAEVSWITGDYWYYYLKTN